MTHTYFVEFLDETGALLNRVAVNAHSELAAIEYASDHVDCPDVWDIQASKM